MIKPSKDGTKLWLIPPDKSKEEEREFDLVYATTCPKCQNLVQALFITDKKIDPKPWEEIFTKILDSEGHYKRIIPGRHERHKSRYSVSLIGRGAKISAQLIRFTEHFERKEDVVNAPVCNFVAISSAIPEYRIYDLLLAQYINPSNYKIEDKDYAGIKANIMNKYTGDQQYAFTEAVGPGGAESGPECVFISRTAYNWFINDIICKFQKAYQNPVKTNW